MRRLATLVLVFLLAGGCAGAGSSPSPSAPTTGFALRARVSQALPPVGAFRTAGPDLAIDQGRLIVYGPERAIYPGRLLPNLQQRPLSQAGIDALVAAARAAFDRWISRRWSSADGGRSDTVARSSSSACVRATS